MANLTLAFIIIQYFLINEDISVISYIFRFDLICIFLLSFFLFLFCSSFSFSFFKLSCLFNNFAFVMEWNGRRTGHRQRSQ